ncbi:uncharacterized protein LOC128555483 [Mercenaria mercenaria]|uniref:uncharacterized protein LOC128555483 n=1 Tax=Mercenaria mercenaria TaxID=6596 RepID=UPI00234E57DA|nr:uncharacterized protein LOC128555483 [Mercenaria mercenaria]
MTMAIIQCLSVIILHLFGIVLTTDSNSSVTETNKDVYIDIFNELREELKEHKAMYIKQIEELRKQVTNNEQRIKQLEGVNEKIKGLNGKCMNEMIMQKTHMDIISERIQHLEGKWEKMKVDNGKCLKETMMLKTKVNNIREKDEDMTDTIKVKTHTRKETEEENKAAKVVKRSFSEFQDRKPAFSAAISGPHITELGKYRSCFHKYWQWLFSVNGRFHYTNKWDILLHSYCYERLWRLCGNKPRFL